MSGFSDIMSYFVKTKEIKVYSMAQYCGLDRSTMYKILNGKRLPGSGEIIQKLSEFMELSPSECQMLWEEYKISRIGKDTYYNRKNITELIFTVENNWGWNGGSEVDLYRKNPGIEMPEETVALQSAQKINQFLCGMLNTLEYSGKHKICMIVQPTYNFLFDMIRTIHKRNSDIIIEHILCLNNSSDKTGNYSYNFQCLKEMIRMFQSNYIYEPYYYYGQIETMFHDLSVFPCMIIVDGFVICFSADATQGIFYNDEKVADLCRNIFNNAKKSARRLGVKIDFDEYVRIKDESMSGNDKLMILQSQPDLAYVKDRKNGIRGVQKLYFTRHGFDTRIKKECTIEACQQIIKAILHMADEERAFILKGRLEDMPLSFGLVVDGHVGMIAFQDSNGKWVCIRITEKYFLYAFVDFIESLEEEELTAGRDETIHFLSQYLELNKG